jgi:SAM-dependent methyltransferase
MGEPARLVRFLSGGVNCWKASDLAGLYKKLLALSRGPAPVTLFDLFFLHEIVADEELSELIDAESFGRLETATILSRSNGAVVGNVRCYPLDGLYFLFDTDRRYDDFVYFGWDSHLMVEVARRYCAGRRFGRSLDLCTGSGVQGLSLSRQSDETICLDINPRAVAMVQANASLNGLSNVQAVLSNLFSAVSGRFDCVTANTPYVPGPPGGQLPIRGGDLGIEFTLRLLEELPDRLSPGGMAVIYTSDPVVRGNRVLLDRLRERLGSFRLRFTQIPLFRSSYPTTMWMRDHYDRAGMRGYDDCILIIEEARSFEILRRHWNVIHYYRTRLDSWLDWRLRASRSMGVSHRD